MSGDPRAPVFYVQEGEVHLTLPLRQRGEQNVEARVTNFRYEDCEKGDDLLELSVSDPAMEVIDGTLLQEGATIKVSWGYPGEMSEPRECIVKEVTPDFGTEIKVKIKAFDKGSNLREGQSDKTWTNAKHSTIAEEIAARHRLTPVVDATEELHEAVPQGNLDDYEFLKRLAEKHGFSFFIDGNELHWHKAKQEKGAEFVLRYRVGRHPNLLTFTPESSTRKGGGGQTRAAVKGFDLDAKAPVTGVADGTTPTDKVGGPNVLISALTGEVEAKEARAADAEAMQVPDEQSHADDPDWMTDESTWPGTEATSGCATAGEAQQQATAQKTQGELKSWKAKGKTEGCASFRAKTSFDVRGVGRKYGGLWWATRVVHSIDSGGYSCEIEFNRSGGPVKTSPKQKEAPGQCQTVWDHFGEEEMDAFAGGVSYAPPAKTVTEIDALTGEVIP